MSCFSCQHSLQDTMALVSLEIVSSTESFLSFKNQRIISSSSLPFLPVGRPGCSLSSRSLTSKTSFTAQGQKQIQASKSRSASLSCLSIQDIRGLLAPWRRRWRCRRWEERRCSSAQPLSWRGPAGAAELGRRSGRSKLQPSPAVLLSLSLSRETLEQGALGSSEGDGL